MAAITINATLSEQDIKRAAAATEKAFKQTFDNVGKFAQDAAKRFADAIGGGNVQAALNRVKQLRDTINALDAAAATQHQRKLVELAERAASQQVVIEQRKQAQIDVLRARQEAAERRHQQHLVEIQSRGVTSGYGPLIAAARQYLTVTAAIGAATRAINEAVKLDSAVRALTAVSGSAQAANEQLVRLREIAKLPGINFQDAIQGATRLQSVGFSAAQAERALKAFSNVIARGGGTSENLREVIIQLGQMSANAKVLTADLRPIVNQSPAVAQALKQIFGTINAKDISEQLKKAGIDTKTFINDILVPALERIPKVTAGPRESLENFGITLNLAFAKIGESILRNLIPTIERLIPIIDRLSNAWGKLSPNTQDSILAFAGIALVARPVFALLSGGIGIVDKLAAAFRGLAVAEAAAGAGGVAGAAARGGLLASIATRLGLGTVGGALFQSGDISPSAIAARSAADARARAARVAAGLPIAGLPVATPEFDLVGRLRTPEEERAAKAERLLLARLRGAGGGGGGASSGGGSSKSDADKAFADFRRLREELEALPTTQVIDELSDLQKKIEELKERGSDAVGIALQKQIFAARLEVERLNAELEATRRALLGIADLPKLAEFKGALSIAGQPADFRIKGGQIPGGPIPTPKELEDVRRAAEAIPPPISEAARFMEGFGRDIETVGTIFDRFGQNVSRAFRNVTDLFNGLKNAVKNFFLDLVGNTLQRLVKGTLDTLFGALNGRQQAGAGGGGGGIIGTILNAVLGGGGNVGGFRTPGFNPNVAGGGGGIFAGGGGGFGGSALGSLGNVANAIISVFRGGNVTDGGGLTAPPSLSVGNFALTIPSLGAAGGGGFLGNALGGISNNLFAGGLVSALPALLGVGLGAGLGGQSTLGRILGGIGGGAVGLGLSFGAAVGGAGGGFGAAALAALGPIALVGVPLLIGAILLGRAKQRKKDEQLTGEFLTDAITQIRALKKEADAGRLLDVTEARKIFESEIMTTFINQVNTIKTKSVRESRLTNQTRDLRALFESEVIPAVVAAKTRGETFGKLVPEFHGGILNAHETFARVLKNESIVTAGQRALANRMAGFDVLAAAGVPGTIGQTQNGIPVAHNGGTFTGATPAPVIVFENVTLALSPDDATRILGAAIRTPDGKRHVYGTVKDGRRDGAL